MSCDRRGVTGCNETPVRGTGESGVRRANPGRWEPSRRASPHHGEHRSADEGAGLDLWVVFGAHSHIYTQQGEWFFIRESTSYPAAHKIASIASAAG